MNFNVNLNNYFKKKITKINHTLLPEEFVINNRRNVACQIVAEIIDKMGMASAKAQDLIKPITSSEKLRNSEHLIYLLVDLHSNNGNGCVIGMLKIGRKNLFIFDSNGECQQSNALCVLDFYVHESHQRMGCGKMLFDYMLKEEKVMPEKLAVDRPSTKFLKFLNKHYGLINMVPQTNNFVVYDGFFKNHGSENFCTKKDKYYTNSSEFNSSRESLTFNGRHTAHKHQDTIGKIIHATPLL